MHETPDDAIVVRIRALERSRSRWRLIALCTASAVGGVLAGGMRSVPDRAPLQAMVIEPGRNAGSYPSTFYAVDATGVIQYLETKTGQGVWTPFKYSPEQGK